MAPNNKESILIKVESGYTTAASAYDKPAYTKFEEGEKNKNSEVEQRSVVESPIGDGYEGNGLRVTTRARYTYELDRFSKNAMLILDNKSHLNMECINEKLKNTFQKFRFEVEAHVNLSCDEIASTCGQFFNRDFTEYGAVAIVVLAKMNRIGLLEANNSTFQETMIKRHFTDLMPPTLKDKPKIYIFETGDFYQRNRVTMNVNHEDILEFALPISIISASDPRHHRQADPRPLEILCRDVETLGDRMDLFSIMTETIKHIHQMWTFFYDYPILLNGTLRKELLLARTLQS